MLDPVVLIGEPLNFKNKLNIYPPTVKQVVTNSNFGVFYKLLTLTQDDINDELRSKLGPNDTMPTVFEYILLNCQYTEGFSAIIKQAFLFFCKIEIEFLFAQKRFLLDIKKEWTDADNENSKRFLLEEDFFDFQNCIRRACGDKAVKPPEPFDPNEDPRITEIKRRARERDRIKAKQQMNNKNGISLNTCLVAICCMGIGITPLNIGEMSYASVGEIMKVMQDKEKYDIDIRSLLAGADSKKVKPKYWIRNIDKE